MTTSEISDTAMVLAAGMGRRMRPLTDDRPKPLVEVAGSPLIDRILNHLSISGWKRAVINVHYMADMLEAHLGMRGVSPEIIISDERDALLDTGGGVKRALDYFGDQPFLTINSDALWTDGDHPTLLRMAEGWRAEAMDVLLLMVPINIIPDYQGQVEFHRGDFHMGDDDRLTRNSPGLAAPYLYGGVQILCPGLFTSIGEDAFSLNRIYDEAAGRGRLYGLVHNGRWFHIGTPQAVADAEQALVGEKTPEAARL